MLSNSLYTTKISYNFFIQNFKMLIRLGMLLPKSPPPLVKFLYPLILD